MSWLEVRVTVKSEVAEAVAEVLARFSPRGVAIQGSPKGIGPGPVTVCAYLPEDAQTPQTRRQIEKAIGHLNQIMPVPEPEFRTVLEADWSESWKEHMDVLHISRRIVIRPSWLQYLPNAGEIVIDLDPGMAFGTGLHPTTQMCLKTLDEHIRPGMRLLDLGTGSGVLAIAGAKLGAEKVLALDTDPQAVKIARQNAHRNGVAQRVRVQEGSLAQVEGTFDLVLVNILASVISRMAEEGLADAVAPGGRLVAAGLVADQEEEVLQALRGAGLERVGRRQMEDWVTLEVSPAAAST